ncbi:MAG: hypothetical protein M1368_09550, partial [Thaumarchaeota archaeon]|nr:hypothetical protein [Nitrososphaerota archaeon]
QKRVLFLSFFLSLLLCFVHDLRMAESRLNPQQMKEGKPQAKHSQDLSIPKRRSALFYSKK